MKMSEMTITRLKEIIEAYGAQSHRWPSDEREQALNLMASSDEAKRLVAEEVWLDGVLENVSEADVSSQFRDQIVESGLNAAVANQYSDRIEMRAPRESNWLHSIESFVSRLFAEHARVSGLCVGACVLGILAGVYLPGAVASNVNIVSEQDIFELAFISTEYMNVQDGLGTFD